MHWAAPLIGKPWAPGRDGPDAFCCWGLVRHVFRERHGIEMPNVVTGDFADISNITAIKKASELSGWRHVDGRCPKEDDIVLMREPTGGRHVGIMIKTSTGLKLLHSHGFMSDSGPRGSVSAQPLKIVLQSGFSDVELWRRG